MSRKRSLPVAAPRSRWTPELLSAIAEGERRARAVLRPRHRGRDRRGRFRVGSRGRPRARGEAKEPPPTPIACDKGCDACCVSKVVVTAPEVIRLADRLRRTRDPSAIEALRERVRAAAESTRGLSRKDRALAGVPCPLLEAGACSVHEVRPLLCRGWTSLDADACRRHFADPAGVPVAPAHAVQYELASAVLAGLALASADAGKDGALLELVAALRIALDRPDAGDRWNAGLPVFSTARDVEVPSGDT